jgi:sugar lactone lactonase YvrE
VAIDGAGNLFVADTSNNTIRKVVASTGAVSTLAGSAGVPGNMDGTGTTALFYQPIGVAVDGAGDLFVADTYNNTIRKVVISSGAVSTLAGTAGMPGSTDGTGTTALFYQPFGVAVDGVGNLFVADTGNATIRKVVISSGAVSTLAGTAGMFGTLDGSGPAAQFSFPSGVAVDGVGNLFVSDNGDHTIRKVVISSGAVSTLAGTPNMMGSRDGTGAHALFNQPRGIAVDGAGNLFVADRGNSTIRKVVTSMGEVMVSTIVGVAGLQGVVLGPLPGGLNSPRGVAVSPAGALFIVDNGENAILSAH